MKLTINSIEIDEGNLRAMVLLESTSREFDGRNTWDLARKIEDMVANKVADQIYLERGPSIMAKITENQLVNAVLIRVGGMMGGR